MHICFLKFYRNIASRDMNHHLKEYSIIVVFNFSSQFSPTKENPTIRSQITKNGNYLNAISVRIPTTKGKLLVALYLPCMSLLVVQYQGAELKITLDTVVRIFLIFCTFERNVLTSIFSLRTLLRLFWKAFNP